MCKDIKNIEANQGFRNFFCWVLLFVASAGQVDLFFDNDYPEAVGSCLPKGLQYRKFLLVNTYGAFFGDAYAPL